jgi:hypothetical protein
MEHEDSAVNYIQILGTYELGIVLFQTLFILSLVVGCCDEQTDIRNLIVGPREPNASSALRNI